MTSRWRNPLPMWNSFRMNHDLNAFPINRRWLMRRADTISSYVDGGGMSVLHDLFRSWWGNISPLHRGQWRVSRYARRVPLQMTQFYTKGKFISLSGAKRCRNKRTYLDRFDSGVRNRKVFEQLRWKLLKTQWRGNLILVSFTVQAT